MKKLCERVLVLFLIGILFLGAMGNVYAKTLTLSAINAELKNVLFDDLNRLGGNYSSTINEAAHTLDFYNDGEKLISFLYTDSYIEYDNRSTELTQESVSDNMVVSLCFSGIVEAIFSLSGHADVTLPHGDSVDFSNTFDKYGIQLVTERYNFSGEEDGSTWSMSGDYVRYFKIALATEKIDEFVKEYGVDANENDPNKGIINELVPTLEVGDITESSVTLYPSIPYTNTDPNYMVYCDIYRSDDIDGVYEKVSVASINCLDGVGYTDEGLKSSTTYYYKTVVVDGSKYSDAVEVVTKGKSSSGVIENPKTGIFSHTIPILIVMTLTSAILLFIRKKALFKTL